MDNKIKSAAAVMAAAFLFAACTPVEEEIPEQSDAVPAAASVNETSEYTAAVTSDSDIGDIVSETEETVASEAEVTETSSEEISESTETDVIDEEVTETETAAETDSTQSQTETDTASDGSVSAIELTFYEVTLSAGESRMPIVTMLPEDTPDKSEIWTSSDESVAAVDRLGNITAMSPGSCVITVQSAVCPEVMAEVAVTVKAPPELTYIDGILIANKSYALPSDYNPGINPEAQAAFDRMQAAAHDEGLNIYISSAFRSYDYQKGLYERYVARSGKAEADRYSARPGHSEHQTGLAFDLNTIDISFADTEEYVWLREHCAEYGFIIRYPENGEAITGYMYEPWHIRYLGEDIAKKVYDSGLTLEEYLGIDSKYDE